jgi:hypothetical protein
MELVMLVFFEVLLPVGRELKVCELLTHTRVHKQRKHSFIIRALSS